MGSASAGPAKSVSIANAYANFFMDLSRTSLAPYAHHMNSNSLLARNKQNRSLALDSSGSEKAAELS
jgi:hypothetical protein